MRRNAYEWAAISAGALLWTAVASAATAQAAGIEWKTAGPFQSCLDAQLKTWLRAKVVLVVNEDPAASKIDDKVVATWATGALKGCAAKAEGGADAAAEQQFIKHMAHWREHIHRGAEAIRRRLRPD